MKKTTSLTSAALFVLLAMFTSVGAWADDSGSCGTDVTYTFEEITKTLTISGTGDMDDFDDENEYPWSSYMDDIETLVVEDGVTSIGEYAFYDSNHLETIVGCQGVTSIGQGAFFGAAWETNLPDGMHYVGHVAFRYKGNMPENTSITLKNGTTQLYDHCFYNCGNLTSITIPSSVTYIGADAFYGCTSITDVYCLADPEKLTWKEDGCDDFKNDGSTKCHVIDKDFFEAGWKTGDKGTDVNVQFVEDLAVFEDAVDNTDAIEALNGQTKSVAISDRTLRAGHWNTICLPFNLDADKMKESFGEGAVVKEFSSYSVEGNNVTIAFKSVDQMQHGTPYIVHLPEGSDIITPLFKDVKIDDALPSHAQESDANAYFYGTYNPLVLFALADSWKTLFLKDDKFYYPTADITVNAFHGIILLIGEVSGLPSEARVIIDWGDDEETTGIEELNLQPQTSNLKPDVWYDLSGRKLQGKPTERGIYMYNGKKVAVQ